MHLITCPSGFAGNARGLKIRELQLLADPNLVRGGKNIDIMLGLLSEVTQPGPYDFQVGSKPNWDAALLGDRFAALIDIRCATWGSEYEFRVRCEECGEGYEWELDLRDLPRKNFPKATLEQLADGGKNEFEIVGPEGQAVVFKILRGADEKAMDAYRRRNGGQWGPGDALAQKIQSVDGVKPGELREWIFNLDAEPARELQDQMDAHDGGVETNIQTVCTHCQWEQDIRLPFGKTFFAPSKKKAPKTMTTAPGTDPPTTPGASGAGTDRTESDSSFPEKKTG